MVAGFTLAGCRDDDCDSPMGMTFSIQEKGDVGILNYAQENITQAGFNTATLFGAAAGSASFDEILSETDAGGIAGLFVRQAKSLQINLIF